MKETIKYNGGRNPYRKNSHKSKKWEQEKKSCMENLNWNIIQDYVQEHKWKVSSLETTIQMMGEEYHELFKKYDGLHHMVEQEQPYLLKNNKN
tara:strand:- start:526 stop:804 length:279 start_codon:yes stop_codon:yes gene_type:complete